MTASDEMPPPPTAEEYYALMRRRQREWIIPDRIADIQRWTVALRADPKATYKDTTLHAVESYAAAAMREFAADDFLLALHWFHEMEVGICGLRDQLNAPLLASGKRVKVGGRKGAETRAQQRGVAIGEVPARYALSVNELVRGGLKKTFAIDEVARLNNVSSAAVRKAVYPPKPTRKSST